MTGNELLRKMNDIEDSDIELSETLAKRRRGLTRWLSAAAAALVLGAGIFAASRLWKDPGYQHDVSAPTPAPTRIAPQATAEPPETTAAPYETAYAMPTQDTPMQVIFNGIEEYRDFAASPELDDDAFREFIESRSYDMNGVNTRQDVKNVLEVMDSVPMPQIAGFPFWRSNLRLDTGDVTIAFKAEGDERHYIGFNMSVSQSDETAEERAAEAGHGIEEVSVEGIPELRYLLRAESGDPANPNSYYYTNIRSHRVTIVTDLAEEELLSILQGCRYTVISEYAGD